jgi:hypothetical protein
LLRSRRPDLTPSDADRIAAALGDLPLAMDQAGALLADTGLTATAYLELLDRRPDQVLASALGGAYPTSVPAAWAAAFNLLANQPAGPKGLQLPAVTPADLRHQAAPRWPSCRLTLLVCIGSAMRCASSA